MSKQFWVINFFWIFICLSIIGNAQNIYYKEVLNISNGAPSNLIYCLFQDSKGYIWAGTPKGLIKYSGTDLNVFTTSDGLSDNEIFDIIEDKKGNLFFSTYVGGISCFDNGKIYPHPKNREIKKSLKNDWITTWAIDNAGNICYSPLNRNSSNHKASVYFQVNNESFSEIKAEKVIEIESNFKLKQIGSQLLIINFNKNEGTPIIGTQIEKAYLHNTDEIYFSSKNTLYILNLKNKIIDSLNFGTEFIQVIKSDKNNLLIGTNSSLYDLKKDSKNKFTAIKIIEELNVSSILFDKESNIWIGTLGRGLLYLKSLENKVYDLKNLKKYIRIKNNTALVTEKNIIINEKSDNVYSYHGFIGSISKIKDQKTLSEIGIVKDILYVDTLKSYWIASNKGVKSLKIGGIHLDSKNYGFSLRSNSIDYYDSCLYIGTNKGLYAWELRNNKIFKIELKGYENIIIQKVLIDRKGCVYAGSNGFGIFYFNHNKLNKISQLNTTTGLSSNFIQDIYLKNGNLWICSNKGIDIYNIEKQRNRQINADNILVSNDVNSIDIRDSLLYIAYPEGIQEFPLKRVFDDLKYFKSIYLDYIESSNRFFSNESLVRLDPNDRNIKIKANVISYDEKVKYRYKFSFDKNWHYFENNTLELQNLPTGDYSLIIEGKRLNDDWDLRSKLIKFSVTPFYYETIWFRIIIFILTTIIAFFSGLLILRYINQKTKNKLKIISLEQRALKSQMNPHFIFNTLNSVLYFIRTNKKVEAVKYVTSLAHLQRMLLSYSFKNLTSLEDEIDILNYYLELEKLRFDSKVIFDINFPKEFSDIFLIPPMLIQPIIENALVHGLAEVEKDAVLKVEIRIIEDKKILVNVEDNGRGFDINSPLPNDSVGVKNILQRIELYNSLHPGFINMTVNKLNPKNTLHPGTIVTLLFNQEKITNS